MHTGVRDPGVLYFPKTMASTTPPALAYDTPGMPPKAEHAIAMKVMSVLRPDLKIEDGIYVEEGDPCYDLFNREHEAVRSELVIPGQPKIMHNGETFRVCISLHNVSNVQVHNISLKAEMMQGGRGVGLLDIDSTSSRGIVSFPPGEHKDFIVEYPLQAEGSHALMCNVNYSDDKEARTFRKLFKFPVGSTVGISGVKIWTISDHVMVGVDLKNMLKTTHLVDLNFCPSPDFRLVEMPANKSEVWQKAMGPDEKRRFVFRLLPQRKDTTTATPAGTFEIAWFGKMGERGRLESTAVTHRGFEKQAVEVTNIEVPNTVKLHTPFTLKATITNNSPTKQDQKLCIVLHPDKMHPLSYTGPSEYFLGNIPYGRSAPVELRLMALASGVQVLNGIEIRDASTGKLMSPTLAVIYVQVTN
eukprot:TRINITY_DN6074_c0_g1_i1.p1 TRINITY_DN6074_c0_g1~~TRINITY_DN6074_c0_g1_i1.p1  ORF type:complete len:415 (+),score=81.47 TRINITY_DN6074_c0_g1_i1:311-1555(+)